VIFNIVGTPAPPFHGWPFGDTATPDVNTAVEYIYLGFVLLQFILALGNRPKGSKWTYIFSFIVFAIINLYLIIDSVYLVYRSFTTDTTNIEFDDGVAAFFQSFLSPSSVGLILLGIGAIFGLYFLASFIYLDPWHMFTSFPVYMLIMPSYTNIINVYAFSNWHDVSWGTKGADKADVLPSAPVIKDENKAAVVEEPDRTQEEIDKAFETTVQRALAPYKELEVKEKRTREDDFKSFRTKLLSTWIFSNALLAVAITSDSFDTFTLNVRLPPVLEGFNWLFC
jgi:chitin synthase